MKPRFIKKIFFLVGEKKTKIIFFAFLGFISSLIDLIGMSIIAPYIAYFTSPEYVRNFDVVIGMYHDQVLTPIKTLFKFKAINVTIGLPFVKVTPDHGPNYEMIGQNRSDPKSILYAFDFLNKIK